MSDKIQQLVQSELEHDGDFVLRTQQQITKDFSVFGLVFHSEFDLNPLPFQELHKQVSEKVMVVIEEGERQFLQLLYRIDIPEEEFFNLVSDKEFLSKITTKIIYREAYKVWLRKKYG